MLYACFQFPILKVTWGQVPISWRDLHQNISRRNSPVLGGGPALSVIATAHLECLWQRRTSCFESHVLLASDGGATWILGSAGKHPHGSKTNPPVGVQNTINQIFLSGTFIFVSHCSFILQLVKFITHPQCSFPMLCSCPQCFTHPKLVLHFFCMVNHRTFTETGSELERHGAPWSSHQCVRNLQLHTAFSFSPFQQMEQLCFFTTTTNKKNKTKKTTLCFFTCSI